MNFLSLSEAVEAPCKDAFSYPLQCFREMFFATPGVVGNFFVGVGGFAIAALIWGAIFFAAFCAIYYLLRQALRGARYFFTQTKVGQKVSNFVPIGRFVERFCCKARGSQAGQAGQARKLLNTQAIGDIVSKVHIDSKWVKNIFKPSACKPEARSPSKTPQRRTITTKLLSPKIRSDDTHES